MRMRIIVVFMLLVALSAASFTIQGERQSSVNSNVGEYVSSNKKRISAYYFYGDGCPHCENVKPFIAQMERKHSLTVHRYEIYGNRSNVALLNQFFDVHAVPTGQRGIPALFISGSHFVGDEPILNGFEMVVNEALKEDQGVLNASASTAPTNNDLDVDTACSGSTGNSECLSLVTVTTAALVDSVSPCSLAVFLFLIGVRPLVTDRRKRALKVGLAFTLSVFVTYTLFGFGLLSAIGIAGVSSAFSLIAGLIAILIGVFYVKDYFSRGGRGSAMEVPHAVRPLINKMIKGVTSPIGAFLTGFALCCFELPCTGGPYLFIIGQLANSATRLQAVPMLLYYNFLFIAPLLLISLFLYFGLFSLEKVRQWNERNKRASRLVGGLTIIALGILVIPSSDLVGLIRIFLSVFKVALPPVLLTLSFYLAFSLLRSNETMAKRLAKTIPLATLLVLSVFAFPLLIKNIRVSRAAGFGEPDVLSTSCGSSLMHSSVGESCGGSCGGCDDGSCERSYDLATPRQDCCNTLPMETALGAVSETGSGGFIERTPDYTIMLKSRGFIPETGLSKELEAIGGVERVHVIIQFVDIPRAEEIQTLRAHGVELLDYLPNYAYFAPVPVAEFAFLASQLNVRSVVSIQLNDKISPLIRNYGVGSWARNEDGTVRLTVVFFEDITREGAISLVETYGRVDDAPEKSNTFMITTPESSIYALAQEDAVQWIETVPPEKTTNLDQARGTIGADIVQAAPYNLDGSGVTVAMWDAGRVDPTHDDFAGRLVIGDGYATTHYHSTHVCGIMAGDGTLSNGNMRGVAINSDIRSYEWPDTISELDTETTNALTNNAILSQNSWSFRVEPPTYPCSLHGDYDSWSQRYDQIVNGVLGDEIVLLGSAGNEENDGDCAPYPWNQTNPSICTAKNSICVGAIYSDTLDHTCFSSRGPTDDGRLKPDIVAPGDEANDHATACLWNRMINSTYPGDTYRDMAGTSMSTPMVSGAVALLRQQFNKLGYGEIKPHTFKAILMQTANDLGNPGPDYTYGHGNLDIREAVDLVINNYPNNELIRTGTVIDNEIDYYYMTVPPALGTLRVTLAWDDIEGAAAAARELVNDLDLFLISPTGSYYYAYKLDPANPANNAGRGYNDRDNLEVVEVASPQAGEWRIGVWGWVVTGTEEYTVVAPYEDINCGDTLYHNTDLGADLSCAADGLTIGANSITLDCHGHTLQGSNTGYGIKSTYNSGTINNCIIRDFDYGIYLYSIADLNNLLNNDFISNDNYGIYLNDAWSNTIRGNYVFQNGIYGLYLYSSRYNDVLYNTFESNLGDAIRLYLANYNDFSYNSVRSNANDGFDIRSSNYTVVSFNSITGNTNNAIYIYSSHYSDVLNNAIDNTGGWSLYLALSNATELRNNIVNHPVSSGVYSSTSYNTVFTNNTACGYSWDFYTPTSTYTADENTCNLAYQFKDSGQTSGCDFECSGCRKAEDNLVISKDTRLCPYTYNIQDLGVLGVISIGASNVELNCSGAELIGVATGSGWGIKNLGYDYVTIRDCKIHNYYLGIAFEAGSNYGAILNNNVSANTGGIRLWGSNFGDIINNVANSNVQAGLIVTQNSDGNLLKNNIVKGNPYGIALYSGSDNNIVKFNKVTGNSHGIYIYDSDSNFMHGNIVEGNTNTGVFFATINSNGNTLDHNRVCANSLDINDIDTNSGDNNFCSTTSNWDDTGTTGCTFSCLLGDVDIDSDVDGYDLYILSRGFGSILGSPVYHPGADVDVDDDIDRDDLIIFNGNFGKTS